MSVAVLTPWLGQDFFPSVDAGQIKLHLRARTGTRIEETARLCDRIDATVRADHSGRRSSRRSSTSSACRTAASTSRTATRRRSGPRTRTCSISLKGDHRPTDQVIKALRGRLTKDFPDVTFYFLPVDMVSQILNFGLPAPIDVQVVGNNLAANRAFADKLMQQMRLVPGIVDLRIQQPFDAPRLTVDVDRVRAQELGYTQRDVAGNLLVALSGSGQMTPTYWLDPKNGVSYLVAVQSPQYTLASLQDIQNIPVTGSNGRPPQILGNLASIRARLAARHGRRTTTRSPSSTSTAACRGRTSARSPARSRSSSTPRARTCRAARR